MRYYGTKSNSRDDFLPRDFASHRPNSYVDTSQPKHHWEGIAMALSVVGEVLLSLIPIGVSTVVAPEAIPEEISAVGAGIRATAVAAKAATKVTTKAYTRYQTGIASAGAVSRLGIQMGGTGRVDALSTAIDFGSIFIPTLQSGIDGIKFGNSLKKDVVQKMINHIQNDNAEELAGFNAELSTYYANSNARQRIIFENYKARKIEVIRKKYTKAAQKARNDYHKTLHKYTGLTRRRMKAHMQGIIKTLDEISKNPKLLRDYAIGSAINRSTGANRIENSLRWKKGKKWNALELHQHGYPGLKGIRMMRRLGMVRARHLKLTQKSQRIENMRTYITRMLGTDAGQKINPPGLIRTYKQPNYEKDWTRYVLENTTGLTTYKRGSTVFEPYGLFTHPMEGPKPFPNSVRMLNRDAIKEAVIHNKIDNWVDSLSTLTDDIQEYMAGMTTNQNEMLFSIMYRTLLGTSKTTKNQAVSRLNEYRKFLLNRKNAIKHAKTSMEKENTRIGNLPFVPKYSKASKQLASKIEGKTNAYNAINSIAKKLAEIKPSFRTTKGYIANMIKPELQQLQGYDTDMLGTFIFASSRQKEKMYAEFEYRHLLNRIMTRAKEYPYLYDMLNSFFGKLSNTEPEKLKTMLDGLTAHVSQEFNDLPLANMISKTYDKAMNRSHNNSSFMRFLFRTQNSSKFRYDTLGKKHLIKVGKVRNVINPMVLARWPVDAAYQTIKNTLNYMLKKKSNDLDAIFAGDIAKGDKWASMSNAERKAFLSNQKNKMSVLLKDTENKDVVQLAKERQAELANADKGVEAALANEVFARKIFVAHGGVLIPANRYMIGYKVIPKVNDGLNEGVNTVMFSFNKLATSSRRPGFKNWGGKKDILVTASDYDLEQLRTIGVDYYWSVGGQKGWWLTRGGRGHKGPVMARELNGELSLFLGFLPVNSIRNILGLVNSYEDNIINWANGKNLQLLRREGFSTMFRTGLNRIGRLTSKFIIGNGAKRLLGSLSFFGKASNRAEWYGSLAQQESQRLISGILALSVHTGPKGQIEFKMAGAEAIQHKLTMMSIAGFKRQALLRGSYGSLPAMQIDKRTGIASWNNIGNTYRHNYIRQVMSAKYKLGYLRRGTGVVYPHVLPKGRSWSKIKL